MENDADFDDLRTQWFSDRVIRVEQLSLPTRQVRSLSFRSQHGCAVAAHARVVDAPVAEACRGCFLAGQDSGPAGMALGFTMGATFPLLRPDICR
jgi:hypothetical protein